jgi:hypothetical protein
MACFKSFQDIFMGKMHKKVNINFGVSQGDKDSHHCRRNAGYDLFFLQRWLLLSPYESPKKA